MGTRKSKKQIQMLTSAPQQASPTGTGQSRLRAIGPDGRTIADCVLEKDVLKITGTHSPEAASLILTQASTARVWPAAKLEESLAGSVAVLEEIGPQNAIEAMLAVQMIGANDLAM